VRRLPIALLVVALAGCGERTPSDEEQVRDVLRTFASAAEKRDYQTLCDEVFAPKLLSGLQEIGLPCEVAMRNSLGKVREPKLTVGDVEIERDTASAEVKTSAAGQAPSTDTVRLERVKEKWKVSALGGSEG
jgi:hypothetical protein